MQKILYVEDDLSLIDGLQYTLEASGYMVDNVKTVKEALALFRKNTYDLLLLDVTLPDGTGFDVCKEVRNSSTVPIIFLTASDQEISIVRGLDMGADDYMNFYPELRQSCAVPCSFPKQIPFWKLMAFVWIRQSGSSGKMKNRLISHWWNTNCCVCSCKIPITLCRAK